MARYHELAQQINQKVQELVARRNLTNSDVADIGHIVNLAVRSAPRGVQHTVREGVVAGAVKGFCRVTMTEVREPGKDPYHVIDIQPVRKSAELQRPDPARDAAFAQMYNENQ